MIEVSLILTGGVLAFVTKNKRWLILWVVAFAYFWLSLMVMAWGMR